MTSRLRARPVFVNAGAAAGPARAAAAEQRRRDRRRRRGVADAHFAEADQIAIRRHRLIAGLHRGKEFAFAHRRLSVKSAVGCIERERNDAQCGAGGARELIDGGAACGEIRHHLRGHLGRIGRDALSGDAVIAGEHEDLDALEPRRRVTLPVREPGDEILQPAEAPWRLGQRGLALRHGGARGRMPARQVEADGAQVGKRGEVGHR